MKQTYRNVAFLAELMINILVFSISCAVLVGLFGQAGVMARETKEKSFATNEAHALMQTVKMAEYSPGASIMTTFYYNKEWQQVQEDSAEKAYAIAFTESHEPERAGYMRWLSARATDTSGREICLLETAVYQPLEGGPAA